MWRGRVLGLVAVGAVVSSPVFFLMARAARTGNHTAVVAYAVAALALTVIPYLGVELFVQRLAWIVAGIQRIWYWVTLGFLRDT